MIYCRDKIYPLGLPNGLAHVLTAVALLAKLFLRAKASFLPRETQPLSVSMRDEASISGRFSFLLVTTLEKLLLAGDLGARRNGALKFVAVEEEQTVSLLRAFAASLSGKLGRNPLRGVHFEDADEITIEGDSSDVILDGESFRAERGRPINLRPARPLSFVKLAA